MIENIKTVFYIIVAVLVLAIFIAGRGKRKPSICHVCKIKAHDYYDHGENTEIYCRSHLAEKWKRDMFSCDTNMMVVEPDFKKFPYGYIYDTLADLKQWNYPQNAISKVEGYISQINGNNCEDCNNRATVAYFSKADLKPSFFEDMSANPIFLCKICTVKKVEPHIIENKDEFAEGLYAPSKEDGVYHVQEF